jgi:hypothetical protein
MKRLLLCLAFSILFLFTANADLTNGLVAYFPFNGNALDATGNGYDGNASNAVLTLDRYSNPNSAYLFNGTNSYIKINKTLPDMTSLTLSTWVLYESGSYQNGTGDVFNDSNTSPSQDFEFGMTDPSHALLVATKNAYHLSTAAPLGSNISNSWAHLVWVLQTNTSTVYLNGSPVVTTTNGGANAGLHAPPLIGADPSQIPYVAFFGGKIDDLRLYNRALSPSEVQQLHALEAGLPLVSIAKAVRLDYSFLKPGTNYQLQFSHDLIGWTNYGIPFTSSTRTNSEYLDVTDWNTFWRLQLSP